jgi:hypothetical protein
VHPHTGNPLDRSQVLKRYLKAAGIRTMRFHDLRHTFGTTVAASGKTNMRTLQQWMGHARLAKTESYADYSEAENEAAMIDAAFMRPEATDNPRTILSESRHDSVTLKPRRRAKKARADPPTFGLLVPAVTGSNPVAHPIESRGNRPLLAARPATGSKRGSKVSSELGSDGP